MSKSKCKFGKLIRKQSKSVSSTSAQFPPSDCTKKSPCSCDDTAGGLTPGHSENDEPCNDKKGTS